MSGIVETIHGKMLQPDELDFQGIHDFNYLTDLRSGLLNSLIQAVQDPDMPSWTGQTRRGIVAMGYMIDDIDKCLTDHLRGHIADLEQYAGLVHCGYSDPVEDD
ncbi:MAG: hypothetical protein IJK84_10865 [Bacteroidales bacterium]|nr:hypothetical protein [Bacteroidales bacterium]MBQ7512645.1 hypothetical protein [Prevotella sp.]